MISAQSLGYLQLKDKQKDVITNFLSGNDVFAILPMGYGKSLCYTCLPRACDILSETEGSMIVVLTPLVAIIQDRYVVST